METNGIRAIADWLAGTTNPALGVNALLDAVPRDAGDPLPASIATFADATRDPWVARRLYEDPAIALPALVVFAEPFAVDGEVQTHVRDAHITFVAAQLVKDPDSAVQLRDALYRRRALLRSIKQFNDNANAAARDRNNIALLVCEDIQIGGGLREQWKDAWAIDAVKLDYLVRDNAP